MPRRNSRCFFHFLFLVLTSCAASPPSSSPQSPEVRVLPEPTIPLAIIQHGKASYYADNLRGRLTAAGEPFDQNAFTAASKIIPLGARAEVTNLRTGKSVIVEVNDRGPRARGRIIDLSRRAAKEIGIDNGVASVKVEARVADQPTLALQREVIKIASRHDR